MKLFLALLWSFFVYSSHAFEVIEDLTTFREDEALGKGNKAKLFAVGSLDERKEPLIFVHGIDCDPKMLLPLISRFENTHYQIYVLAYSDLDRRTSKNGDDFAASIRKLRSRNLTIVAHSMGGLVSRRALNTLGRELERFETVKLFSVDTPWHGFRGPSDRGFGRLLMPFARPFLRDGYEDMRAKSDFFRELYSVKLPSHVSIHLAFAEEGIDIKDYTEMDDLQLQIERRGKISGSAELVNLWKAMKDSVNYGQFLSSLQLKSSTSVREILFKTFPRFSGDHPGIVKGNYGDFLESELLFKM